MLIRLFSVWNIPSTSGGILPAECDPTNAALATEALDALRRTKRCRQEMVVCRAYRRFLSLQEPQSRAFLGYVVSKRTLGMFPFYDLMSTALAQLWKGDSLMVSLAEMDRKVDGHFFHLPSMLGKSEPSHTARIRGVDA